MEKKIMITRDTRIDECKTYPELKAVAQLFSGRCDGKKKDEEGKTFAELNQLFSTWNPDSMIYGLERVREIGEKQDTYVFPVYEEQERKRNTELEHVQLIYFPGDAQKPFVIVCAGGAYMSVSSMGEAFPVAAKLNEMGYTAFALNYRTSTGEGAVIPKPLDDLAAAVKFIYSRKEQFHLQSDEYAVCGFSAGANLANMWGLENCGYKKYGMKKPNVLFCCYTVSSLAGLVGTEGGELLLNIMFGKDYEKSLVTTYDILPQITGGYPPCYIVACEDDDVVPVENSFKLIDKLKEMNVPYKSEIGKKGGHGFGDGRGTDVENWIERAVQFWEKLARYK